MPSDKKGRERRAPLKLKSFVLPNNHPILKKLQQQNKIQGKKCNENKTTQKKGSGAPKKKLKNEVKKVSKREKENSQRSFAEEFDEFASEMSNDLASGVSKGFLPRDILPSQSSQNPGLQDNVSQARVCTPMVPMIQHEANTSQSSGNLPVQEKVNQKINFTPMTPVSQHQSASQSSEILPLQENVHEKLTFTPTFPRIQHQTDNALSSYNPQNGNLYTSTPSNTVTNSTFFNRFDNAKNSNIHQTPQNYNVSGGIPLNNFHLPQVAAGSSNNINNQKLAPQNYLGYANVRATEVESYNNQPPYVEQNNCDYWTNFSGTEFRPPNSFAASANTSSDLSNLVNTGKEDYNSHLPTSQVSFSGSTSQKIIKNDLASVNSTALDDDDTLSNSGSSQRDLEFDGQSNWISKEFQNVNKNLKNLYQLLDDVNNNLKKLCIKVNGSSAVRPNQFPIKNIGDLLSLENMSSEEFENMILYFRNIGGGSLRTFCNECLKDCMTNACIKSITYTMDLPSDLEVKNCKLILAIRKAAGEKFNTEKEILVDDTTFKLEMSEAIRCGKERYRNVVKSKSRARCGPSNELFDENEDAFESDDTRLSYQQTKENTDNASKKNSSVNLMDNDLEEINVPCLIQL